MTDTDLVPLTHADMNALVEWTEQHVFTGNEYKNLGLDGLLSALHRAVDRGAVEFEGTVVEDSIQSAITEIAWNKNFQIEDYPFEGDQQLHA